MPTLTNVRYKGRTDTEANWISSNPILLEGEPAYLVIKITDTKLVMGIVIGMN